MLSKHVNDMLEAGDFIHRYCIRHRLLDNSHPIHHRLTQKRGAVNFPLKAFSASWAINYTFYCEIIFFFALAIKSTLTTVHFGLQSKRQILPDALTILLRLYLQSLPCKRYMVGTDQVHTATGVSDSCYQRNVCILQKHEGGGSCLYLFFYG